MAHMTFYALRQKFHLHKFLTVILGLLEYENLLSGETIPMYCLCLLCGEATSTLSVYYIVKPQPREQIVSKGEFFNISNKNQTKSHQYQKQHTACKVLRKYNNVSSS